MDSFGLLASGWVQAMKDTTGLKGKRREGLEYLFLLGCCSSAVVCDFL